MNANHDCDIYNTIRSSSSSLIRAPSWSFGVGSNESESDLNDARTSSCSIRTSRSSALSSSRENGHDDSSVDTPSSDNPPTTYPKLDISIPTAYLTKQNINSPSFHVYQLKIKTSEGHEWSIYRRYSQFHALHQKLKSSDPIIGKFNFPPKRRLNSKASTIVQDRKNKLEDYIRSINNYFEQAPQTSGVSVDDDFVRRSTTSDGPSPSRVASACGLSCLSDSVESDQLTDEQSREHQEITRDSNEQNYRLASPVYLETMNTVKSAGKINGRSLFHEFISLDEKRDEEFNLSSSVQ